MSPSQYLLKNISRNDINLGDLRYRIPAGKTRDLLGKGARLSWLDIQESKKSGSISKRLGKSLIEVNVIIFAVQSLFIIRKAGIIKTAKLVFTKKWIGICGLFHL